MFGRTTICSALILSILIIPNDGKLPDDFKPCKAEDSQCLIETINKIIETKSKGDPELNLDSIDPLHFDEMVLKQSKTSPVSVSLIFRNSDVTGYHDLRAYKVRGFGANPEGKHEIFFKGISAQMTGDYSIDGKVLILPIKGEGRSNLTLDNVMLKMNIEAGSKVKDGATYLDVKNIKLNLNTTRLYMDLSNLFNGDKALGDNMNKFLNENWQDVFMELREPVLDGFSKVFTDFVRKVFDSHPYSELVEGGK